MLHSSTPSPIPAPLNASEPSLRILLVEDSPVDREMTMHLLELGMPGDHLLRTAGRLGEAISILSLEPIDIVLLDLGLPDSHGVSTLARLHAEVPAVPVVVLSGTEEREMALEAVREGAHDYVMKERVNPDALARIVRFAIERQRRMTSERELQAAEQVQANLFPHSAPQVPGFDIAGSAQSAGTGCGDYFDFLSLPTGEIGLVVGDVSGHGMSAALRMVETRAYLRSLARQTADLGTILSELNRFMVEESAYGRDGLQQFVTLFLAALDPERMELRYASAGHAAYVVHFNGQRTRLASTGIALGIVEMEIESAVPLRLMEGDMLVIPTDGIEETMTADGTRLGVDRMLSLVAACRCRNAAEVLSELYRGARDFTDGNTPHDDMTAIIAKVKAPSPAKRHVPGWSLAGDGAWRPAPIGPAAHAGLVHA